MHKMAFAHIFGPEKKNGFDLFSYKFFVCVRVGLRPALMGTKNLYENGPDSFFFVFFDLMGMRMVQICIAKSV